APGHFDAFLFAEAFLLDPAAILLVEEVEGERFAPLDGGVEIDRDGDQPEADGTLPDRPRHWSQPARRRNSRSSPESFGDGFTFARQRRPSRFMGRRARRGSLAVAMLGSAIFVSGGVRRAAGRASS